MAEWSITQYLQDISARSPILYPQEATPRPSLDTRQSLDSRLQRQPAEALNGSSEAEPRKSAEEEGFEDVGLNDEAKLPPKKEESLRASETAQKINRQMTALDRTQATVVSICPGGNGVRVDKGPNSGASNGLLTKAVKTRP